MDLEAIRFTSISDCIFAVHHGMQKTENTVDTRRTLKQTNNHDDLKMSLF